MAQTEQLETLKSHLNLVKSMQGDKAQDQFYQLMEKAKQKFGQEHLYMAEFYYEYAKFIIEKMQKNIDIFNTNQLPKEQIQQPEQQMQIVEEEDSSAPPKKQPQQNPAQPTPANVQQANNQPTIKQSQQKVNPQQNSNNAPKVQQAPNQTLTDNQNNNQGQTNKQNQGNQPQQQQDDDFQVAATNLIYAIKIFEKQRQRIQEEESQTLYNLQETQKFISRCRSRLGDLYHLNQNYLEAIQTYNKVVEEEQKNQGHQKNRGLAQIHFFIANSYLYDNKQGCQMIAIKQFIKSVNILLNHLHGLNPNDQTQYQIPSETQTKVDRFAYLPKASDSQEVKQIKQVISCLLDKIEDTYEQIGIRKQYEQIKNKKQQEQPNKFSEQKQTSPIVNLGTFGNRKRKPEKQKQE